MHYSIIDVSFVLLFTKYILSFVGEKAIFLGLVPTAKDEVTGVDAVEGLTCQAALGSIKLTVLDPKLETYTLSIFGLYPKFKGFAPNPPEKYVY